MCAPPDAGVPAVHARGCACSFRPKLAATQVGSPLGDILSRGCTRCSVDSWCAFHPFVRSVLSLKSCEERRMLSLGNCVAMQPPKCLCCGFAPPKGKNATLSTLRQAHGREKRNRIGAGKCGSFASAIGLESAHVTRKEEAVEGFGLSIYFPMQYSCRAICREVVAEAYARLCCRDVEPCCNCRMSANGVRTLQSCTAGAAENVVCTHSLN